MEGLGDPAWEVGNVGRVMGMCAERYRGEKSGWSKSLRLCQRKEGWSRGCSEEAGLWGGSGFSGREREGGSMVAPEFAPISRVT